MLIPWGTPTISDATKVRKVLPGTLWAESSWYELMIQLNVTEDFPNLAAWTIVESAPGNISVAGGVVSFLGSGAFNANGIYRTMDTPRVLPAMWEFKLKAKLVGGGADLVFYWMHQGQYAPLSTGVRNGFLGSLNTRWNYPLSLRGPGDGSPNTGIYNPAFADNDWVTFRVYMLDTPAMQQYGHRCFVTVEDPTVYTVETLLLDIPGNGNVYGTWYSNWTTIAFQRFTLNAITTDIKEFRYYKLYPVDGPYLTFNADAGAGFTFQSVDWSTVAMPAGLPSTNLRFKVSFDDGGPSWSPAWLTLAQLQALGLVAGPHRYVRIQVQLNSDSFTQCYADAPQGDALVLARGGGAVASGALKPSGFRGPGGSG